MISMLSNKAQLKLGFFLYGIFLAVAGIIINGVGTCSLKATKNYRQRQTYFLIDISVLSMIMCCLFIPLWSLWCFVSHERSEEIIFILQTGFYLAYASSTIGLTFDRFFSVAMPFKHRTLITAKIVKAYIACCWLISLLSRIPFFFLASSNVIQMVNMDIAVDSINLIFQPLTYTYIFFKLKVRFGGLRNQRFDASPFTLRRVSIQQRNASKEFRLLKISCLICSCCLIASISDIMYSATGMTSPSSNQSILSPIGLALWHLPIAFQPLIYIIIKPEIRSHLKRKLCSCFSG